MGILFDVETFDAVSRVMSLVKMYLDVDLDVDTIYCFIIFVHEHHDFLRVGFPGQLPTLPQNMASVIFKWEFYYKNQVKSGQNSFIMGFPKKHTSPKNALGEYRMLS